MSNASDVLNVLMQKMNYIINYGDTTGQNNSYVNPNGRPYVIFCRPGIPAPEAVFDFSFVPSQSTIQAASDFSYIVNIIPPSAGPWSIDNKYIDEYPDDAAPWRNTGRLVWSEYKRVLDYADVPAPQISAQEKKMLERIDKILFTEGKVFDPTTLEEKTEIIETPLHSTAKKKKAAYIDAVMAYNAALVNAQTSADAASISLFNVNGPFLRAKVAAARDDWISSGGEVVENALARLDQIVKTDPAVRFSDAKVQFDLSKRVDLMGQDYHFTSFYPGAFRPNDSASWARHFFSESESSTSYSSSSSSWGGGFSAGVGPWRVGSDVSGSRSVRTYDSDASGFEIEYELARVPIRRSWLDTSILFSENWKSDAGNPVELSDGNIPPSGSMVAIPTEMYIVRKLHVNMNMSSIFSQVSESSFSASASISYGPFRLKGRYKRDNYDYRHDTSFRNDGFDIEGPQIIAFGCLMLPKAPKA